MFGIVLKAILAPIAGLWEWLSEKPARLAFALLIALCGFLCLRLSMVDGDRDKWRDRAKQYEAASKAVKDADVKADAVALGVAADKKGSIDAGNERAKAAAANSPDPLRDGIGSLRAENAGGSSPSTR
jgi:hypothetical protein